MLLEEIFGSKARAALVGHLFAGGAGRTHLRELSRESGLSAPNLLRAARSLRSIGVLNEERDGNRVFFSANPESPFHDALRMLAERSRDPVPLLREVLAQCGAEVAFIYGSRAAGTARADSDYDLFLIGKCGLREVSALLAPIREMVPVELNPYVISREEFVHRVADGDHFLKEVLDSPKIYLKGDANGLGAMVRQRLA